MPTTRLLSNSGVSNNKKATNEIENGQLTASTHRRTSTETQDLKLKQKENMKNDDKENELWVIPS